MSTVTPPDVPLSVTLADLNALAKPEPKLPAVPNPPADLQSLQKAVVALKEIVETREGRRGLPVDQNVTWRDLFGANIAQFDINGGSVTVDSTVTSPVGPSVGSGVSTIPPAPTGFTAEGAVTSIILTWDTAPYSNHAYTEIWRADIDDIGSAVWLGTSNSSIYVDTVGGAVSHYYWIRFVSSYPQTGPFNGTSGTLGQTGTDPALLLELLTGDPGSPFFNQFPFIVLETPTTINGVLAPAGVYVKDAFIANGTISNAMIGNAVVDTAKIANLAVATAKIADAAITNAKIQDATIQSAKIGDAQITTAKINDAAITNAKIANAVIALAKIDTATITNLAALSADLGSITAGSLNINGRFIVNSSGVTTIQSATSGARLVLSDDNIKVYDGSGVLRVKIGNLA